MATVRALHEAGLAVSEFAARMHRDCPSPVLRNLAVQRLHIFVGEFQVKWSGAAW